MILNLKNTIITYLKDAGFKKDAFVLDDEDNNFVEVFFTAYEAVEFIMSDIKKTKYDNILDIKKYKYKNGNISAIITFKEDDNDEKE